MRGPGVRFLCVVPVCTCQVLDDYIENLLHRKMKDVIDSVFSFGAVCYNGGAFPV